MENTSLNNSNKVKKQSKLRLIVQCISFAFHNGYINGWTNGHIYSGTNKAFCVPGLNCYSCPGAIGACPIGSLQAVLDSAGFNISLYVIGFIGMVGVFCGRFICGWLCPFGLVQDLFHKIPILKKRKNMPGHKYLRYLRFIILAIFVIILPMSIKNEAGVGQPWFCEFICPSGTLLGGIPLVSANEVLQDVVGIKFIWKIVVLLLILVCAIIFDRPFCKYICPLGALYGIANPISIYRLKIEKEKCVSCGICQKVCGADIKVWETPNSIDCIRCGKCKMSCPTGAITSTFNKKTNPEITIALSSEGVNTIANGKKIKVYVAGIMSLVMSGYALFQIGLMIYIYISAGSASDVLEYLKYLYGYFVVLVPSVMLFIFGSKLLITSKTKDKMVEFSKWPALIMKTIGLGFVITYVGYVIITIMIAMELVFAVFVYPIQLMLVPIVIMIILLTGSFISWILIR